MIEGGLYRLLVYPMELVHSSGRFDDPFTFEEAQANPAWWDSIEIGL